MNVVKRIELGFKAGGSDKVYNVSLVSGDAGYSVHFEYGRRGSVLQSGSKVVDEPSLAKAEKVYATLVKSKTAKGYTEIGGSDVPAEVAVPVDKQHSGIYPQLLTPADDDTAFRSDEYLMQEKHDGQRRLLVINDQSIRGVNKLGFYVPVAALLAASVRTAVMASQAVVDGELVGSVFYAFDLLELNGRCIRRVPYVERLAMLERIVSCNAQIKMTKTVSKLSDKVRMLTEVDDRNGEGVVYKRAQAAYVSGRTMEQYKYKFYDTISAICLGENEGKRSIQLGLYDNGILRNVGNVTVPSDQKIPSTNAVVEVRYLYAFEEGSVYQPVLLGERDDIELTECVVSQLKYKAASAA